MMLLASVLLLSGVLALQDNKVPCTIKGRDASPYEVIHETEKLTIACQHTEPVRWIYPRQQAQENKNYTWYGWDLPPGEENRTTEADSNGKFSSVLTVPGVIPNDTGVYKCVPQANDSVTIAEYFYYVLGEQLLISGRISVYGYIDSPLNFPCRPASPDVEVQLLSSNINITEDNIFCDPRSGFTMKKAMSHIRRLKRFTCIATSINNSSINQTAKIGVIIRNDVTKRATSAIIHESYFYPNVTEGSNVTMNCTSRNAFNVHWYKQPGWIKLEQDVKWWNSTIPEMLHKLYDVKKNDSGIYECVAYNGTHGLSANVTLKVFGKNETFLEIYPKELKSMCIVEEEDFEQILNISSSDVPQLQLSHNGIPVNKANFYIEQHIGWARLKMTNATKEDSGIYTLIVSVSDKTKEVHFNVTVADKAPAGTAL